VTAAFRRAPVAGAAYRRKAIPVRRRHTLRFGGKLRAPAMQAGIANLPLPLRESFLWQRPPSKYPPGN